MLIPAYNEATRLPPYLNAIREHFARNRLAYEVIVIDDGSTDGTSTFVEGLRNGWAQLRLMRHTHNEGRGQAIRTGSEAAHGDLVLFADADGATPIEEETKLRAALDDGADVAIGSRVLRHEGVSRFRAFHRAIISKVFATLVRLLVRVPVRDTQCGFKMWRRGIGNEILQQCTDKGWLLDVEFLAVAYRRGYRIAEVPVTWSEIPGSKVNLIRDSWRMFRGLWRIRRSLRLQSPATLFRA